MSQTIVQNSAWGTMSPSASRHSTKKSTRLCSYAGQFSKRRGKVKVSTNSVEGLFGRMKRFMRTYRACPRSSQGYAAYLAEYLWRNEVLKGEWRQKAFLELCHLLRLHNKPTVVQQVVSILPFSIKTERFGMDRRGGWGGRERPEEGRQKEMSRNGTLKVPTRRSTLSASTRRLGPGSPQSTRP